MPTDVRLMLKGLLVLDAKAGRTRGKVGILTAPPPPANPAWRHQLTIKVRRVSGAALPEIPVLTRPNVSSALSLEITNGSHPTIAIRNRNAINRHQAAMEPESLNWFVDMENTELYNREVGSSGAFESLLTFDGGQVFTFERPNDSILMIQRRRNTAYEPFGRVALKLGIDFFAATRAVFKNGNTTVFDSSQEPGVNYTIDITHDALEHPPVVEDANHYYSVLGTMIPEAERILFKSETEVHLLQVKLEEAKRSKDSETVRRLEAAIDELVKMFGTPAGPEAACFPTYLTRTDL